MTPEDEEQINLISYGATLAVVAVAVLMLAIVVLIVSVMP